MPIGTDEYAKESAMEIVENGRAAQLARMLPRMPNKRSASLIAIDFMVQRTAGDRPRIFPAGMRKGRQQLDVVIGWPA